MKTLVIEGLDKTTIMQLEMEAHHLNMNLNELAKQLIHQAVNQSKPSPTINSIFGVVQSKTDGVKFQNAMREKE
jgi:hypothetical protein